MPDEIGFDGGSFSPPENKIITPELARPKKPRINLAKETSLYFPGEVNFPAEDLGVDVWQQMVDETQKDRVERGFELTVKNGKVKISKVFADIRGTFVTPSQEVIRQFIKREKLLGTIHTHYYDDSVDTLTRTGIFSIEDLLLFANSPNSTIMGMIDKGGFHMMIKNGPKYRVAPNLPEGDFLSKIIKETRSDEGKILNVMQRVASDLNPAGISYYFTPDLSPNPDETVTLTNVQSLDHIPPRE